jgi:multicomponent K+:H+ antiporter subunit E
MRRPEQRAYNRKARHRLIPYPLQSGLLFTVWLMLNNSLAPAHIALAVLLALALPFWWHRFWPHATPLHRPDLLARLMLVVIWDVIVANVHVAMQILGPSARLRPAFVDLPLVLEDELAIALLASIISIAPGTVTARISADRSHLIVHMLDVDDAERAAADIKRRYEAPLKEIFGC